MRLLTGVLFGLVLTAAVAQAKQDVVKAPDGKVLGVILDCSSCEKEKAGGGCEGGSEAGFHDKKPCGACLIEANFGTRPDYPYDLTLTGFLKDEKGEPIVGRFVRLFLANTWTVRTRTVDKGMFLLRLGATAERKDTKPIVLDLGVRTMKRDSKASQYAMYFLQEGYKPCKAGSK